jgi:hypothetical protein
MGSDVVYESRLELARLLLADFDPAVEVIYGQPFRLTAVVGGRVRRHVPDFLLGHGDGTACVVNVKPAERLNVPKIAEALAWPAELFDAHGWAHEVWSGADPVVLENVRFLAAYRRPSVLDPAEMARVLEQVRDEEQLAVAERRLSGGDLDRLRRVRPALLALLWSGRLITDLDRSLSGSQVLRRTG